MAIFAVLAALGLLASCPATALAQTGPEFAPNPESARQRGPEIFNAVHDAMRQWGSSVHHNGMSFFLATVPEGVLLHHGNGELASPDVPDWLAYEIEHAEGFAHGRRRPPKEPLGNAHSIHEVKSEDRQKVLGSSEIVKQSPDGEIGGRVHVYRTTRPLRFLYVDGMSGGKTTMGTLDTQDYLLRGDRSQGQDSKQIDSKAGGGPMGERQRADELCELCKDWKLQGVIRMEAGFEIIKCDFSDGMDQVQALRRPKRRSQHAGGGLADFEWLRGITERYSDIGASRTLIDYSSMVSSFFYPANLTNPDKKRQDLPRLSATTDAELATIKAYLQGVVEERRDQDFRTVEWQGVSDLIVSRYADRLEYMAQKVSSVDTMAAEIGFLLDSLIDYDEAGTALDLSAATERCINFYLPTAAFQTQADLLINTAFSSVTSEICETLFRVRQWVVTDEATVMGGGDDAASLRTSKEAIQQLIDVLRWARFKRCPSCDIDEVCLIPMWPVGAVEDYYNPHCTNSSSASVGESYWGPFLP